jgi:hypothetical protein
VIGVAITTVAWLAAAFLARPTDEHVLRRFVARVQPGGPGWRRVEDEARRAGVPFDAVPWTVPKGILAMVAGCFAVYCALFAIGYLLYGRAGLALLLAIVSAVASVVLVRAWAAVRAVDDAVP